MLFRSNRFSIASNRSISALWPLLLSRIARSPSAQSPRSPCSACVASRKIEDTPVLYRRQMAAYRAVLRDIFPGRHVVCALVWTQTSEVVILPDELLDLPAPVPT